MTIFSSCLLECQNIWPLVILKHVLRFHVLLDIACSFLVLLARSSHIVLFPHQVPCFVLIVIDWENQTTDPPFLSCQYRLKSDTKMKIPVSSIININYEYCTLCEKFEDIKMVAGSRKMKGRWYNGKRKKREIMVHKILHKVTWYTIWLYLRAIYGSLITTWNL